MEQGRDRDALIALSLSSCPLAEFTFDPRHHLVRSIALQHAVQASFMYVQCLQRSRLFYFYLRSGASILAPSLFPRERRTG